MQELVGYDIRADLTGGDRRDEERLKGRPQAPVEMRRQGLERCVARVERAGETALGREDPAFSTTAWRLRQGVSPRSGRLRQTGFAM